MGGYNLNIVRTIDAPPERVFDAWMTREHFAAWIGPAGVRCDVTEHEPRVDMAFGGAFIARGFFIWRSTCARRRRASRRHF